MNIAPITNNYHNSYLSSKDKKHVNIHKNTNQNTLVNQNTNLHFKGLGFFIGELRHFFTANEDLNAERSTTKQENKEINGDITLQILEKSDRYKAKAERIKIESEIHFNNAKRKITQIRELIAKGQEANYKNIDLEDTTISFQDRNDYSVMEKTVKGELKEKIKFNKITGEIYEIVEFKSPTKVSDSEGFGKIFDDMSPEKDVTTLYNGEITLIELGKKANAFGDVSIKSQYKYDDGILENYQENELSSNNEADGLNIFVEFSYLFQNGIISSVKKGIKTKLNFPVKNETNIESILKYNNGVVDSYLKDYRIENSKKTIGASYKRENNGFVKLT